jgi:hypothetical protein
MKLLDASKFIAFQQSSSVFGFADCLFAVGMGLGVVGRRSKIHRLGL